jgi:hypothetical protein
MQNVNNNITLTQWQELMHDVNNHVMQNNLPHDIVYSGSETRSNNSTRFFCYDNYDNIESPGLDFIISDSNDIGSLIVYNASEQARAPISFNQAKDIAQNFFNINGSMLAEEIVCDWVMEGNQSVL